MMTHGGKRSGAGRKRRKYRLEAPHRKRARFTSAAPVHVVMRGRAWICDLRRDTVYDVLREVLVRYRDAGEFRIVHISIQDNHLHLVVEAASSFALARGMRSFSINAARAVNAARHTRGPVFFRYHSTVIGSRRYARNVIEYVLGNWRRHRRDIEHGRLLAALLDRYSSAISFTGWTKGFTVPEGYSPLPVSRPTTYLLREGWRFAGPMDPQHTPGPLS